MKAYWTENPAEEKWIVITVGSYRLELLEEEAEKLKDELTRVLNEPQGTNLLKES
jgi:hypothetical protein